MSLSTSFISRLLCTCWFGLSKMNDDLISNIDYPGNTNILSRDFSARDNLPPLRRTPSNVSMKTSSDTWLAF